MMTTNEYIAGSCNIGKSEIRQRQIVALVGLFLSVSALAGFISAGASAQARLGMFLPLSIASIGWIQSRKKFCLAYGFMGTFNFAGLGKISKVTDKQFLAADRRTAAVILIQSLGLAAIITAVICALPLT
jgi:hypothetical protein